MKFISSLAQKSFSIFIVLAFLTSLPNSAQAGMASWYTMDTIFTTALQSDGKIIIGGLFTAYNGSPTKGIARLNTDGTLDTTFNTALGNGSVNTIAIQPDGKVLLGGYFVFGETKTGVVRLNTDGTLDEANFSLGVVEGQVHAIAIQPDGKILVGGHTGVDNEDIPAPVSISRINPNGTIDELFEASKAKINLISNIKSIAIQPDGKIIIGGDFDSVDGVGREAIARLNSDGTLDDTFYLNPGMGEQDYINTIAIQADGKILVGGHFTALDNNDPVTFKLGFARLNSDGTLDDTFYFAQGYDNGDVHNITLQPDGKILVGGEFYNEDIYPTKRSGLDRLNSDGIFDVDNFPLGVVEGVVNTLAIQSDGKILIGGSFSVDAGTTWTNLARLNTDGTLDTTFPIQDSSVSITNVVIKTTPTKTVYNEGDLLDLSGLVLTLTQSGATTYDDAFDVSFNDWDYFADNYGTDSIITASKANGATLSMEDTSVLITVNGHSVEQAITVVGAVDSDAPTLTLIGDTPLNISTGSTFTDPGATAEDAVDGNITDSIVVTGNVDTETVGSYTLTYTVTDVAGNVASEERIVNVTDLTLATEESPVVASNSITITWTTSHPATSRVLWDTVSHSDASVTEAGPVNYGYANSTTEDATFVTDHSVVVSGLIPSTTYFFRPVSHGSPEMVGAEIEVTTAVTTPTRPSNGGGGSLNKRVSKQTRTQTQAQAPNKVVTVQVPEQAMGVPKATVKGAARFQFANDLSLGQTLGDVKELQKMLRAEGFFTYPEDTGYFGEMTRQAVMAFQRAHGISPVSGYVGPLTRAELNKVQTQAQTGTQTETQTQEQTGKGEEMSVETFIDLLIVVGVIPADKAEQARSLGKGQVEEETEVATDTEVDSETEEA